MIKIINESTGKEVFTINDKGDLVMDGGIVDGDVKVKEAFEAASEEGDKNG